MIETRVSLLAISVLTILRHKRFYNTR